MAYPTLLRIPKPKTFLYLMSLRTGTELITLTLLINKLTGLYGLLAIITGLHLSPLQLSMYIYSLCALALAAHLAPHIRRGAQSPFEVLALAWLYLVDSVINAAYTAAFGFGWFLVLAQHASQNANGGVGAGAGAPNPAGSMMGDVAGFTNPSFTVSSVDVVVTSAPGSAAQAAGLVGHEKRAAPHDNANTAYATPGMPTGILTATLLAPGSIASLTTILALWAIRVYFILVMLAYARAVLRAYIVSLSQTSTGFAPFASETSDGALYAEDPFSGWSGWKGWVGRGMVGWGRGYWLGVDEGEVGEEGAYAYGLGEGGKGERGLRTGVGSQAAGGAVESGKKGVGERERRRRAGTPPLLRPIELKNVRK